MKLIMWFISAILGSLFFSAIIWGIATLFGADWIFADIFKVVFWVDVAISGLIHLSGGI